MLEAMVKDGYRYALLVEDDCVPVAGSGRAWWQKVIQAASAVKCDATYLGGNVVNTGALRYHYGGGVFRAVDVLTTHAIVWRINAAKWALDTYNYQKHGVFDLWMAKQAQRDKVMTIVKPFLAVQPDRFSEIQLKQTDYSAIWRDSEGRFR